MTQMVPVDIYIEGRKASNPTQLGTIVNEFTMKRLHSQMVVVGTSVWVLGLRRQAIPMEMPDEGAADQTNQFVKRCEAQAVAEEAEVEVGESEPNA